MSAPPCSPPVTCPGSDNPILNLSSEAPDHFVNIGLNWGPVEPPPTNRIFTNNGCLGQCTSTVSQEDADLCAARQALICVDGGGDPNDPNNPKIVCNSQQVATVSCPDGLPFSYTVPAGLFCGYSQTEVDQEATDYAARLARGEAICLGSLQRCACVGVPYSSTIKAIGGSGVDWTIMSGSLPPGLSLSPSSTSVTISGTPTTGGTYTFSVRALTPLGNYMVKTFTIVVVEITTTTLTSYAVGTPYSFQLQATGGSGSYAWKILSGTLPDGLTLSITGLISGTPTGTSAGSTDITFEVIDTACKAVDSSFFVPRVKLTTASRTTIATLRGFNEYIASTPPKKYRSVTWIGEAKQTAIADPNGNNIHLNGQQICGAKIVWDGTATVDFAGNLVSKYTKNLYATCAVSGPFPIVDYAPPFNTGIYSMVGYCWAGDPSSQCSPCDFNETNWGLVGDIAQQYPGDAADGGFYNFPVDHTKRVLTSTTLNDSQAGVSSIYGFLPGTPGYPTPPLDGLNLGILTTTVLNYSATLSDEYTDADALAHAVILNSTGATAQTLARTTGFVSQWTSVNFVLSFTNLVDGASYTASVLLFDSDGSKTTRSYGFTAKGTDHTIHDSVPTPAQGHWKTVASPTIHMI